MGTKFNEGEYICCKLHFPVDFLCFRFRQTWTNSIFSRLLINIYFLKTMVPKISSIENLCISPWTFWFPFSGSSIYRIRFFSNWPPWTPRIMNFKTADKSTWSCTFHMISSVVTLYLQIFNNNKNVLIRIPSPQSVLFEC